MEDKVKLVQTSGACPEQYNAYINGVEVGVLHLRDHYFHATFHGKKVYDDHVEGDGLFNSNWERSEQLHRACERILEAYNNSTKEFCYEIVNDVPGEENPW